MTASLKLSPQLNAELKAGAARERMSKSEYMRQLLEKGVKRSKKKPTLRELMGKAIGCFDSGKTDRATNPKYMRGYGKWRS